MTEDNVTRLVQKLAEELAAGKTWDTQAAPKQVEATGGNGKKTGRYTIADYPLMEKHPGSLRTPTGKTLNDITLANARKGELQMGDLRISKEALYAQADIAEDAGKPAMKKNLLRAAELTEVPDEVMIQMYDQLRPGRATKAELLKMAEQLETKYQAVGCGALVREACQVYELRGILRKD